MQPEELWTTGYHYEPSSVRVEQDQDDLDAPDGVQGIQSQPHDYIAERLESLAMSVGAIFTVGGVLPCGLAIQQSAGAASADEQPGGPAIQQSAGAASGGRLDFRTNTELQK